MKTVYARHLENITTLYFYDEDIEDIKNTGSKYILWCTDELNFKKRRLILPYIIEIVNNSTVNNTYQKLYSLEEAEELLKGKLVIKQEFLNSSERYITEVVYKYISEHNLSTNYTDWSKKDLAKFKLKF